MTAQTPPSAVVSNSGLQHPKSVAAFRRVTGLVGTYLSISVLTLVAIIVLRNDASIVNAAVWIRGTIVVASAALMFAFTLRATRGSRRGYLRVRLVSGIMLVAIVVILALPGTFPLWMKVEQGVCGLLLLIVVVIVNGKHLRTLFADRPVHPGEE